MRGARRPALAALVLALLLPLVGCGESRIDAYCGDLDENRKQLAEMLDSSSPDALFSQIAVLRELAKKSPSDLDDEWRTFLGAVEGLRSALTSAGVTAQEFGAGSTPAGLSAAEKDAIVSAADQLSSDDVVAAASGIEQQARDVCKVNLGL